MSDPVRIGQLLGPVLAELREDNSLDRWIDQVRSLRGCTAPIHLAGERCRVDASTGEILSTYSTEENEPRGALLVRCKNRRVSVCASCSEEYRADAYQLIKAGITGGSKGVPSSVGVHPRVFVTLTAPSFGPVHRGPGKDGTTQPCHPRRSGLSCTKYHRSDDPLIGQPLDPESYDYVQHVLWQAHSGELWRRFIIHLRHHLASAAGLTRTEFAQRVRVSYAKVAEFQARGVVHFHAVIRLDGARGPSSWPLPPVWASLDMLIAAVHSAVRATSLEVTVGDECHRLAWGEQYDVRPIGEFGPEHGALSDTAVAGYIAKYATKAAEEAGGLDRRLTDITHLDPEQVRPHVARLIETCWRLGNRHVYPELEYLNLRKWAHMLGFRGHFLTKSRSYSTTLGSLRQARADYSAGYPWDPETWTPTRQDDQDDESTLVLSDWRYLGQGFTPGELALVCVITGRSPTTKEAHDKEAHDEVFP